MRGGGVLRRRIGTDPEGIDSERFGSDRKRKKSVGVDAVEDRRPDCIPANRPKHLVSIKNMKTAPVMRRRPDARSTVAGPLAPCHRSRYADEQMSTSRDGWIEQFRCPGPLVGIPLKILGMVNR